MKKLLLVMLVPVLVLGLFSCGKVLDGDAVLSAMQGRWYDTGSVNSFVLTGNQATVFKGTYAEEEKGKVAFRISASGAIANEKNIDPSTDYEGQITFYGFEDKKRVELGKITVTFTSASTGASDASLEVTKSEKAVVYQNLIIPPVGKYTQN